jgi:murein DD-endopeptidase MepM/ murein hydrolase activator NlpD
MMQLKRIIVFFSLIIFAYCVFSPRVMANEIIEENHINTEEGYNFELNPSYRINEIRKNYLKRQDTPLNPKFFGEGGEPWRFPISAPNQFFLTQGYNGSFSHQNSRSLDLASGSNFVAATKSGRIGIVNFGGKWNQWCNSYNDCFNKGGIWNGNHIVINHSDGTSSYYIHLQGDSLLPGIFVGRDVSIGTPLARIGGTGFTCNLDCSGPFVHLHFQVNQGAGNTIATPFDDCNYSGNNCSSGIPFPGPNYTSINFSSEFASRPGPIYAFGQSSGIDGNLTLRPNPPSWTISGVSELKLGNLCLTHNANLNLANCNNSNNQKWNITSFSTYQNQASGKCLLVDSLNVGNSIKTGDCNNSFLQQFRHLSVPYKVINFPV